VLADAPIPAAALPVEAEHTVVTGVCLDSRSVHRGDLYAALPGGTTHGARFGEQAVAAGAAAILTDPAGARLLGACPVPVLVVPDPRSALGRLSAWVYGDPAERLLMLGVTGTNGKTTLTHLLAEALTAMDRSCGLIGTIGVRVGNEMLPSARTTPEAPDVHALLALMVDRGVRAVAMEVSSHALALGRVDGIVFDVAVFTNLSQDHLDFHGTMLDYFDTKAALFTEQRSRAAVICTEDRWGRQLAARSALPTTTYSAAGPADWTLEQVRESASGAWRGTARGPGGGSTLLQSRLPGAFNRSNALGALATLVTAGAQPTAAAAGIASCAGVPGRMEPVGTGAVGAFVDYAHTPDAVGRAIEATRGFCPGRIVVVLGCGGDRDAGKRPEMGRVAAAGSDVLIVTDDNPRSEDPAVIRAAVLGGARGGRAEVVEVADRADAIAAAVRRCRAGDAVLVLGKGHETGREVRGTVTPFDDRTVLAAALRDAGLDP
jgi:UDP-N-acetylmuramoyl-L-alanyl-D-glutamate--2,6-diaminopimelate ligase